MFFRKPGIGTLGTYTMRQLPFLVRRGGHSNRGSAEVDATCRYQNDYEYLRRCYYR
jgi:hypothetical protein